jgi:hypothetical protein
MMEIKSDGKKRFTFLCIAFLLSCILAVAPVAALHDVSVSIDQPGGPCSPAEKCILFTIDVGLVGNDTNAFLVSFPKDDISVPSTIDPGCINISWNNSGTWTTPVHPDMLEVNDTFPGHQLCPNTTTIKIWTPIGIPTNKQVEICFLPCSDITMIGCNLSACISTDQEGTPVQSSNTVSPMYNVTIIQSENGTIIAETSPPYPCGSTPSFDIIPDPGFEVCNVCINSLGGNDPCFGNITTYTFDPLDQCWNITADFCQTGNISGYKVDEDGNPLSGWEIKLFNLTSLVGTDVTGSDGKYTFNGLPFGSYKVNETLQPGWMLIDPDGGFYEVTIDEDNLVFDDLNFTNEQVGNISGYKLDNATGLGIPDWLLMLYNGELVYEDMTYTNVSGFYIFTGLPFDTYTVTEELKPGYVNITPVSQGDLVIDEDHLDIENVNFTNEQNGTISGYKLDNATGFGIPDWLMTLSNESSTINQTQTDGSGFYIFTGLPFDTYTVTEELKPGYANITPLSQDDIVLDEDTPFVDDVNFTNVLIGTISGYKLDNVTGLGIPDWKMTLSNESTTITETETDITGFYIFIGLPFDTFTVTEELKTGYVNITPLSQDLILDEENPNIENVNFTNELTTSISGYKLDNATGLGIPDWEMTLSNESEPIDEAQTDESGFYIFSGLPFDTYTVTEELKTGYMNITPLSQDDLVIDEENLNIVNINFTNELTTSISGYKLDNATGLGIPDWEMTLSNESETIDETQTDESGFYIFSGLPFDTYTVTEELKTGYMNVTPLSQDDLVIDEENLNIVNINFSNELTTSISGYKLDNATGLGIPDWEMTLSNSSETVDETQTDESGFYIFSGLPFDTYTVTEELKTGYMNVTPLSQDDLVIDEENLNIVNVNFSNELTTSISGYKLDNATGLGIPDWEMELSNESGTTDSTQTDESGFYIFSGLPFDRYTVTEELKTGYMNITPLSQDDLVIDEENLNIVNVNFTNEIANGTVVGWIHTNCNLGELAVPEARVRASLSEDGLFINGSYWEVTTDIGGFYGIPDLPTGVPLFLTALSPESAPDKYHQYLYQIYPGSLIVCEDIPCVVQLSPLAINETKQVNWIFKANASEFQ